MPFADVFCEQRRFSCAPYPVKIVVLSEMGLCFTLYCTMSSGSRKFCDYLRSLKLFFQRVSNMLAYCFNISAKKLGKLVSIQPYGICIYLYW